MTRKMVEVVTDETAVVIPVLFAVIIKKKRTQNWMWKCRITISRASYTYTFTWLQLLFSRFCTAYGLKLFDLMVVWHPKTVPFIRHTFLATCFCYLRSSSYLYQKWRVLIHSSVNLLKPTGYVTHQQFNIQQLYALPTLYLCVLYLSENKQRLVPLTA